MLIRIGVVSVVALGVALAQGPGRGPGPRGAFGPGGPGGPGGGPGARFLGAEAGMGGRVVKGAPVTADIVTETTQTLTDGNRIRQSHTVRFYRDSEGRTRRETSFNQMSQLGTVSMAGMPQLTFINDPVAGASYALNANDRTASHSAWTPRGRGPAADSQNRPPRPGPDAVGGGPGGGFRRGGSNDNMKTESLGRQTIEGVTADGTRTTITIPSGRIGNDAPIQIVHERWYSSDLQMVVLEKQSDPRHGDTVMRFANVNRSEPSRTLFEVPADYKVTEGRMGPRPTVRQ